MRVAREEIHFMKYALNGTSGDKLKRVAETDGLEGIVWASRESNNVIYFEDLITGRRWESRGIYNKNGPTIHETGYVKPEVEYIQPDRVKPTSSFHVTGIAEKCSRSHCKNPATRELRVVTKNIARTEQLCIECAMVTMNELLEHQPGVIAAFVEVRA